MNKQEEDYNIHLTSHFEPITDYIDYETEQENLRKYLASTEKFKTDHDRFEPEDLIMRYFKRLSSVHQSMDVNRINHLLHDMSKCYEDLHYEQKRDTLEQKHDPEELLKISDDLRKFKSALSIANAPEVIEERKAIAHYYLTVLKSHPFQRPVKTVTVSYR